MHEAGEKLGLSVASLLRDYADESFVTQTELAHRSGISQSQISKLFRAERQMTVAQLGALQLWLKAKEDPKRALSNYRAALKLGGTRPLPELFASAGIRFDFSERTLAPLMAAIEEELDRLPR